jgi:hypothetical protein
MVTGEERLREFLGGLYGDVNTYDGKPTDEQVARADVLGRELDDVIREFTTTVNGQLPAVNRALAAKQMPPIQFISEQAWRDQHKEEISPK